MLCVSLFCFQRGKSDPAAADHGFACSMYHVSADRAYIETAAGDIGRAVPVSYVLTGEQFYD